MRTAGRNVQRLAFQAFGLSYGRDKKASRHGVPMRVVRGVRLTLMAATLLNPPLSAGAQSNRDTAELDRTIATFDKGDRSGALALAEDILTRSPQDQNALFYSAAFNFQMGNNDAARGRLERLVKLAGNFVSGWELMVQVAQAQGDLARRDEAIARLKVAITTAIDPAIRAKADFIRDRIPIGDQALFAADYFQRGGSDFTRYQFSVNDPRTDPDHGIFLRTDEYTTENWSDTALLPQDKQLFHLDVVDARPEGGVTVAIYQYYVGEPDYDTVRAEVMKILRGEVRPLSGEAGGLAGILKK
jgi:tetratricopeptide (TPR) repeat protein